MIETKALIRGRIDREFEAIPNYPMTVVAAPMGYGKTTAIRQFSRQRDATGTLVFLLTLDESERISRREFSSRSESLIRHG